MGCEIHLGLEEDLKRIENEEAKRENNKQKKTLKISRLENYGAKKEDILKLLEDI